MITIVLAMAILSYMLKLVPLGFPGARQHRLGWVVKSVDYAVCFIIGGIIVNVALGGVTVSEIVGNPSVRHLIAVITLLIAYLSCKRTGSILKSLFASLIFFAVAIGVLP